MKKIALLSYGYLTADPRIITIADSLKAGGWDVICINLQPLTVKNKANDILSEKHVCHNLTIQSWMGTKLLLTKLFTRFLSQIGLKKQSEHLYFKAINTYIKKVIKQPAFQNLVKDVDVFYGCEMFFGAFIAYHAANQLDKAFIFDIKELYSDMTSELSTKLKNFILHYETSFINQSMMFPCVSKGIGEYYSKLHHKFKEKQYVLLPNTPSKLPEVPVAIVKKDKPLRFVMLAGFVPHIRGIELLVKIWASLVPGNATLDLYLSNISEANKQHLLSLAGVAANKSFFIKAPIKEDDIIETLVNYDVGIIPYLPDVCLNHRYCCPGKFGQYLKAGLAVLSSNTENITQPIQAFHLGAVYPVEDFSVSSEVFQAMIDAPEKIETMKHNAKHFFHDEYHWDIFAKDFVTEINRVFSSYNLSSSLNQPA